jgi:hypothetical protein
MPDPAVVNVAPRKREQSPLVCDAPTATPPRQRHTPAPTAPGVVQGIVDPCPSDPPPLPPLRKRGRPPRAPPSRPEWSDPTTIAARGGISIAQLWRLVARGLITPPAYLGPKCPRFHNETFDNDLKRLRATPQQNEAGRRAAKLAEARARKRAERESHPSPGDKGTE